MLTSFETSLSLCVTCMSALLADNVPDGWLWAMMIPAALSAMASANTSLGVCPFSFHGRLHHILSLLLLGYEF